MSKKVLCRSLSSIHILYNQASVGGLSDSFDSATLIDNIQLDGGSTVYEYPHRRSMGKAPLACNEDRDRAILLREMSDSHIREICNE